MGQQAFGDLDHLSGIRRTLATFEGRCHAPARGIVETEQVVSLHHLRDSPHRDPGGTADHGRAHAARKSSRSRQLRVRPQHRAGAPTDSRVPVRAGPPVRGSVRRRRRGAHHLGIASSTAPWPVGRRQRAGAEEGQPPRTHWDMLLERRSMAERGDILQRATRRRSAPAADARRNHPQTRRGPVAGRRRDPLRLVNPPVSATLGAARSAR